MAARCRLRALAAGVATVATLALYAGPAPGDTLDLCYEAETARAEGEAERAIVYYTRCIAEGGLAPANLATAYNNRGVAYHGHLSRSPPIRFRPRYHSIAEVVSRIQPASARERKAARGASSIRRPPFPP